MISNLLINLFFYIPIWLIKIFLFFKRDVKRKYSLDPQAQLLLSLFPKYDIEQIKNDELSVFRESIEKDRRQLKVSKKTQRAVKKVDHFIGDNKSLLIREYEPYKTDNQNIILYFHGGGYVLNSVETHDDTVSYFSEKLRTRIFSLDYRLAPENKFPNALEDSLIAISWLESRGILLDNISLCGDSAGGHLAASLSHYFSEKETKIHSQFLIYPMCDPACESESQNLFSEGYFLTQEAMRWFWECLISNEDDNNKDTFNLLKINKKITADHTFIVTAGFDPLHDEAEDYASLLHNLGNNVKQLHYPSLFHGFASITKLKKANDAVNDMLIEYKKIL